MRDRDSRIDGGVTQSDPGSDLEGARTELTRFFELSLDLLCIAGTDGYFKSINPAFERVLGYSRAELLSTPFLDLVHPDDRASTVREVEKLASGRPTIAFGNRYRCKDGSLRWLEWTAMPIPEEGKLFAIARDVTKQKELDAQLQVVVESAPVTMLLIDEADRITLVNRRACTEFGYLARDLVGLSPQALMPPRFRGSYERRRAGFFSNPEAIRLGSRGRLTGLRKNGTEFPIEIELNPVMIGRPHLLCVITDTTERKKAMDRVHMVVESLPDGVLLVDSRGKLRLMNAAAERMFGHERSNLLGESLEILVPESGRDAHVRAREKFMEAGGERPMGGAAAELFGARSNGERFPVDVALKPIQIDGESYVIATVRDLTERKKAERELVSARQVQLAILPKNSPIVPGFEIAAKSRPAQTACGDFFDFTFCPDGLLSLAIGDVSGKGLGPAILTASIMSHLRSLARRSGSPSEILSALHLSLHAETRPQDYATAIICRLATDKRVLEFSNAGHPPAYVFDGEGSVTHRLARTGLPLGMLQDSEYAAGQGIALLPGQTVVFVTDGISEANAPDDECEFGEGRILDSVRSSLEAGVGADEIATSLIGAARSFTRGGAQRDDMTVMVIKVLGTVV